MKGAGALLLVLAATLAAAEPYAVGGTLRPFSLEDQHGERAAVGERTRVLVLSRDMGAGDVVKGALADSEQRYLDELDAVYVADISGMPALVSRMIAVPRMRERKYRVLLDRDGAVGRDFPYVEKRPTVIALDQLRIVAIEHPATAAELRAALERVRR
jgi:hypothetical protein